MDTLRIGSFFSGIGAFEKALERLEIPHKTVFYCEIDKYASKAYSLIHNVPESFNLWDITKIDEANLPDFDLMTWGFPCQDISVAGKQAGIIEGETRSGLYYDGLRILRHKKPKYSIIENAKNLVGKKFEAEFNQMLCDLEDAGYRSYWQVLNAKDYGIPQNRERVFIVSIRNDIDDGFAFPLPFDNGLRLKDLLEDEVDEKYYISQEKTEKLIESLKDKDVKTLKRTTIHDSKQGGNLEPKVLTYNTKDDNGKETSQQDRVYNINGVMATISAQLGGRFNILENYRIRKLTPLECFRLMGFDDADFKICKDNGISDSQLYKMAGNSIVVQVLEGILNNLLLQSGATASDCFYGEQLNLF